MAVKVGSARIDERGKATGGKAGDQNGGKEVSTQNWYLHSKGWNVFRAIDPEDAKLIAKAMIEACDNNQIGYDQNQRNTLYTQASKVEFSPVRVATPCETDCSALVRVCCAHADIMDIPSSFRTANLKTYLLKTGKFMELKGDKYTKKSDYLKAGDILCTRTSGHVVIAISDGPKANEPVTDETKVYQLGDRVLRNGDEGPDVKELQSLLIQLEYDCGKWGADGDFGDATEMAVRNFQTNEDLEVDGIVGKKTLDALYDQFSDPPESAPVGQKVKIKGGNCYVRVEPNKKSNDIGVAKRGETYPYLNERSEDGWHKILFKEKEGWVSGKYSEVVQ